MVIVAVLCWSPFNALAYVAPFIAVGLLVLTGNNKRSLKRAVLYYAFYPLATSLYWPKMFAVDIALSYHKGSVQDRENMGGGSPVKTR